jgi:hypothetical protein
MNRTAISTLAILAAASGALAQVGTGVTLSTGSLVFKQADWPTVANATAASLAISSSDRFRINDLGPNGSNQMGANMWFFRTAGGLKPASNFNNAVLANSSSTSATWTFATIGNAVGLSASLTASISQSGPKVGQLSQVMTLSNSTADPITIQLFNFMKFHAFVPAGNQVSGSATAISASLTSGTVGYTVTSTLSSATSTRWQIDGSSNSSGVLNSLITANNYNLNNTAGGNVNALNPMGALQWQNLVIPAGGSISAATTYSVIPAPSALALLGLGTLAANRRRR